jgi:hypothetical protein
MRYSNGWTCLHHALSLPDPSPAAAAWIAAALALPGIAALREEALRDLASCPAEPSLEAEALTLFRGDAGAAQVRLVRWFSVTVSVATLQTVFKRPSGRLIPQPICIWYLHCTLGVSSHSFISHARVAAASPSSLSICTVCPVLVADRSQTAECSSGFHPARGKGGGKRKGEREEKGKGAERMGGYF